MLIKHYNHVFNQKNEATPSIACELVGLQHTFDNLGAANISPKDTVTSNTDCMLANLLTPWGGWWGDTRLMNTCPVNNILSILFPHFKTKAVLHDELSTLAKADARGLLYIAELNFEGLPAQEFSFSMTFP